MTPPNSPHPDGLRLGRAGDAGGVDVLAEFGVSCEMTVASAHRSPERVVRLVREAAARGVKVFIVGAGAAAHLAGVVAAHTSLPVIGVPIDSSALERPRRAAVDRADASGGAGGDGLNRKAGCHERRSAGCADSGGPRLGTRRRLEAHKKKLAENVEQRPPG